MHIHIPKGRVDLGAIRRAAALGAEARGVPQSDFMEGAVCGTGTCTPPGLPWEVMHLVG